MKIFLWGCLFVVQAVMNIARVHAHEGYYSWFGAVEWGCVAVAAVVVAIDLFHFLSRRRA